MPGEQPACRQGVRHHADGPARMQGNLEPGTPRCLQRDAETVAGVLFAADRGVARGPAIRADGQRPDLPHEGLGAGAGGRQASRSCGMHGESAAQEFPRVPSHGVRRGRKLLLTDRTMCDRRPPSRKAQWNQQQEHRLQSCMSEIVVLRIQTNLKVMVVAVHPTWFCGDDLVYLLLELSPATVIATAAAAPYKSRVDELRRKNDGDAATIIARELR
ncbi:hypothetical protein SAMN05421844_10157 [Bosea robiniae]|uniref:Transposase IS111A/IS1328/IS1533 N-terminal domain-containing protein n=1 Tax=Bosea robiniae TaxID=1036780 RepID=A0ABY0NFQ8_9HYPH|nr:hypothetical protein SAMN05421844_10157 [Bosea robiniae]